MVRVPLLLYGATGRMGRAVRGCLAEFPEVDLRACVAPREPAEGAAPGPIWLTPAEFATHRRREPLPEDLVVLDFSLAAGTAQLVQILTGWPRAVVAASTGLDAATEARLEALAAGVPVLRAPNLSLGNAIAQSFIRALPQIALKSFVADIVEHHHEGKKDVPSGTALALAELLRQVGAGEGSARDVRIHSIRAGSVPGTHRILLSALGESLEIVHTVDDRAVFARGALRAARFVHGRAPGRYTIDHLLAES